MPIKPNKGTQGDILLKALREGRVTTLMAMTELHIASLHRRLTDLKEMGWLIAVSREEDEERGTHHNVYRLVDDGKDVA